MFSPAIAITNTVMVGTPCLTACLAAPLQRFTMKAIKVQEKSFTVQAYRSAMLSNLSRCLSRCFSHRFSGSTDKAEQNQLIQYEMFHVKGAFLKWESLP